MGADVVMVLIGGVVLAVWGAACAVAGMLLLVSRLRDRYPEEWAAVYTKMLEER